MRQIKTQKIEDHSKKGNKTKEIEIKERTEKNGFRRLKLKSVGIQFPSPMGLLTINQNCHFQEQITSLQLSPKIRCVTILTERHCRNKCFDNRKPALAQLTESSGRSTGTWRHAPLKRVTDCTAKPCKRRKEKRRELAVLKPHILTKLWQTHQAVSLSNHSPAILINLFNHNLI